MISSNIKKNVIIRMYYVLSYGPIEMLFRECKFLYMCKLAREMTSLLSEIVIKAMGSWGESTKYVYFTAISPYFLAPKYDCYPLCVRRTGSECLRFDTWMFCSWKLNVFRLLVLFLKIIYIIFA